MLRVGDVTSLNSPDVMSSFVLTYRKIVALKTAVVVTCDILFRDLDVIS